MRLLGTIAIGMKSIRCLIRVLCTQPDASYYTEMVKTAHAQLLHSHEFSLWSLYRCIAHARNAERSDLAFRQRVSSPFRTPVDHSRILYIHACTPTVSHSSVVSTFGLTPLAHADTILKDCMHEILRNKKHSSKTDTSRGQFLWSCRVVFAGKKGVTKNTLTGFRIFDKCGNCFAWSRLWLAHLCCETVYNLQNTFFESLVLHKSRLQDLAVWQLQSKLIQTVRHFLVWIYMDA